MDLLYKIQDCQTIAELDALRDEIHIAASHGEIDFKYVKKVFVEKKAQLEKGVMSVDKLNWIV